MAVISTNITLTDVQGSFFVVYGTFSAPQDVESTISTDFSRIIFASIVPGGAFSILSIVTQLPTDGGDVTFFLASGVAPFGTYKIIGIL